MHWIDAIVVGGYLLGMLIIGFWLTRRVESSKDFFLAGRKLPFWAIGMSLVVSDIGALEMVGGTANAYKYGVAQANYEWIGCVPAMMVGAFLFIPIYWRAGVFSVPEYLGRRYGSVVQAIQAGIWTIFLAAALGVFFQAAAAMFHGAFGWPQTASIVATAAIVSLYTVGGGLQAVVVTDVIQCVILFIGGLIVAAIGLDQVGGVQAFVDGVAGLGDSTKDHFRLLMPVGATDAQGEVTGFPWTGVLLGLGFVLSPAYWLGNQAIVQRVLAAKDEWSARASLVFGAVLKTFVPLAFVLPGLLGLLLIKQGAAADDVYPILIRDLMPVGIRGLLYAAFLAALMSSVDSYTNSAATIFVRDVYQKFWVKQRSDRHYLVIGRFTSLVIIVMGVAMVPVVRQYETIYTAFQSFLSYFQGPTLALLLIGFLWREATPVGGVVSLVVGVLVAVFSEQFLEIHFLHAAWWSFLSAGLVLIVVSRFTPALAPSELAGLVLGIAGKNEQKGAPR